jgi:hypothetical protein
MLAPAAASAGGYASTGPQRAQPALVNTLSSWRPAVTPDRVTPSVVGSYIAMTLEVNGLPCFNCVNGFTNGTFGTGDPLGYINSTLTTLQILWVYFDVTDTNVCQLSIVMTQGTKTLASASGSFAPSPGGVFTATLKVTRKSTWHGAALMTGSIVCGSTTATNKGSVYFQ